MERADGAILLETSEGVPGTWVMSIGAVHLARCRRSR